jgi:amino acid transporter
VLCGAALLALGLVVNLLGINPLKYFVNAGIFAEAIASIGIGVLLLLFFRNHSLELLFSSLGALDASGGSYWTGLLTALAVGGWAFLGFDACSQISEETTDARVSTPRAILRSMLVVGLTVLLTAFAVTLSYKDPAAVVSGQIIDPVTPAVVDAFGAWAERPFVAIVLIAFVACVVSVQTYIGRAIFGMARDAILPGSALLRRVDGRKVPMAAMVCSTLLASLGLALGLNATAVGTLIAFGSGGFFFVFLIVAVSALYARLTGRWDPDKGALKLGRKGLLVNVIAVLWLVFEAINVAWPREMLAPPGAPWFQVWAVIVVFSVLSLFGLAYLFIAKPHRRIATSLSFAGRAVD